MLSNSIISWMTFIPQKFGCASQRMHFTKSCCSLQKDLFHLRCDPRVLQNYIQVPFYHKDARSKPCPPSGELSFLFPALQAHNQAMQVFCKKLSLREIYHHTFICSLQLSCPKHFSKRMIFKTPAATRISNENSESRTEVNSGIQMAKSFQK